MKLQTASKRFDRTLARDAYGTATLRCQLAPLDLFKVDGVSVKKRQLFTAPEVIMPDRGVVMIDGEPYLVGSGTPDFWNGEVIRRNYVIQGADGLAKLNTIENELVGILPTSAYAALVFNRYLPDNVDSSKYPPQYQVFLAGSEGAPADSLITLNGTWYIVKESYVSNSGLRISLVNRLESPLFEMVPFHTRTYDPVTDSYTQIEKTVKVMRVMWQEHFRYLSRGSVEFVRGDVQVFVLKSGVPMIGTTDTITLSDGTWRVMSVIDDGGIWSIHVRRA